MQRILFLVHNNQYNSKRHFTEQLSLALTELGVTCLTLDTSHGELTASHLQKIREFAPDLLASYSLITAGPSGAFICDELQIPHLSLMLDSVAYVLPLTGSDYSLIACVDEEDVRWLAQKGFKKAFFLPHAAAAPTTLVPFQQRPLEAVFIGSCYDFIFMKERWQQLYPHPLPQMMEEVAETMRRSTSQSIVSLFFQAIKEYGLEKEPLPYLTLLEQVDYYMRGKDRFELLTALKNVQIDLFGSVQAASLSRQEGWQNLIDSSPHIQCHPAVSYEQSLQIVQQSKICLNSCPSFKTGGHERLFAGLAAGAVTVTNRNDYVQNVFSERDLFFYTPDHLPQLNQELRALLDAHHRHLTAPSTAMADLAERGRQAFLKAHTFKHRAQTLLQQVKALL